jgi:hypothetical protein
VLPTYLDLSRRSQFIEPFLIACSAKNPKYAGIGINCLQRLAVSSGLPKSRLKEILEAVRECSGLAGELSTARSTRSYAQDSNVTQALTCKLKFSKSCPRCFKTTRMTYEVDCFLLCYRRAQYCKVRKPFPLVVLQQPPCNSLSLPPLTDLPSKTVRPSFDKY